MASKAGRKVHTGPTTLSAKTQYLVLYNLISLILWLGILLRLAITFVYTQSTSSSASSSAQPAYPFLDVAYPAIGNILKWTQTLALVEVVHALTGLVRTSVLTTGMQVASRLLLVWGIVAPFGRGLFVEGAGTLVQKGQAWGLGGVPGFETVAGYSAQLGNSLGNVIASIGAGKQMGELQRNQAAFVGMVLAWSVTEVIRYLYFIYYASSGTGKAPELLTWLRSVESRFIVVSKILTVNRYNTFFILYPIGISCECWLIYSSLPFAQQLDPRYALALVATLAIYVPGSYTLYTHMVAQRRKVMKGKSKAKDT